MNQSENSQFLGTEKISTLMLKFSVPCVLSLLVSALYNIVDQIFIGNSELSALGNAATGVVFPFFIIAALLASLVLMAVFFPPKAQLLSLFGASENSLGMAIEYFNIILAFFPIYMLSNMMNAVIRADGSPSWSMASMLLGAIINIILDPVFIFGMRWGMTGAALATVIISLVCNIMLAKYGAMSQYGIDIPIAIIGIESKVFTVVINLVVGIVLGCQPIIGYNIGAKNYDRVRQLYKSILICTLVIGIVSTLLFELAPQAVVGIFGQPTNIPNPEDYWMFAGKTFRIFLSLVTFTCTIKMTSIFFQAVGKPIQAVVSSMIRDIICFIPLILILPVFFGIEGILYAAPAADFFAMIVAVSLTAAFMRSLKETPSEENAETVLKPSKKGVIVTIAREHGSLGKQIGKLVAEKMGIPFYYKEMTALAAQESGLDREFISDLNANSPAMLHSLYLSTDVVKQAVAAQDKVIRRIADNGSCVIVGRAADYVLRDYPDVVRIFLYAPTEYKIQRIMEVYGDDREAAAKNIHRSDEARAAYYKNISGSGWGDRKNYELLLDSSAGPGACADIICSYLQSCGHASFGNAGNA